MTQAFDHFSPVPEPVFNNIIRYLEDPRDRARLRAVCRRFFQLIGNVCTAAHVRCAEYLPYAAARDYRDAPQAFLDRRKHLEEVFLSGRVTATPIQFDQSARYSLASMGERVCLIAATQASMTFFDAKSGQQLWQFSPPDDQVFDQAFIVHTSGEWHPILVSVPADIWQVAQRARREVHSPWTSEPLTPRRVFRGDVPLGEMMTLPNRIMQFAASETGDNRLFGLSERYIAGFDLDAGKSRSLIPGEWDSMKVISPPLGGDDYLLLSHQDRLELWNPFRNQRIVSYQVPGTIERVAPIIARALVSKGLDVLAVQSAESAELTLWNLWTGACLDHLTGNLSFTYGDFFVINGLPHYIGHKGPGSWSRPSASSPPGQLHIATGDCDINNYALHFRGRTQHWSGYTSRPPNGYNRHRVDRPGIILRGLPKNCSAVSDWHELGGNHLVWFPHQRVDTYGILQGYPQEGVTPCVLVKNQDRVYAVIPDEDAPQSNRRIYALIAAIVAGAMLYYRYRRRSQI